MAASRKTLTERIRLKAMDLHQKNGCTDDEPCSGPTKAEWEQATAAVMHNQEADAS